MADEFDERRIQELKAKIQRYVEAIQQVIPDFRPTQQQLDSLLSRERIELHLRAKRIPGISNDKNGPQEKKVNELVKVGVLPGNFQRTTIFMVKTDGSEESERYNRELLEDLTRDDEIGEIKRSNFFLKNLNTIHSIDFMKLPPNTERNDYYRYALEHEAEGNRLFEMQNFVQSESYFKLNTSRLEGPGSIISPSVLIGLNLGKARGRIASESFLTSPFSLLTDAQLQKLREKPPQGLAELSDMLMEEGEYRQVVRENKWKSADEFPRFGQQDLSVMENTTERVMGGFESRRENLIRLSEQVLALPGFQNEELNNQLNRLKELLPDFMDSLNTITPESTEEELEAFTKKAGDVKRIRYQMRIQLQELSKTDDAVASANEVIKKWGVSTNIITQKKELSALLYYEKVDRSRVQNEPYGALRDAVKALDEELLLLRTPGPGGDLPRLTQEELYALRSRMAGVLKLSEDYLEAPERDSERFYAERIRELMQGQIRALGDAYSGTTIDEALSSTPLMVNADGRKLEKRGNSNNIRLSMTIRGRDGSDIRGFFTEAVTTDSEKEMEKVIRELSKQYPGHEDLIRRCSRIYLDPDPTLLKERRALKTLQKGLKPEQLQVLDTVRPFIKTEGNRILLMTSKFEVFNNESEKCRIDTRNIAMTDVAELLGVPDLLARSVPMQLMRDGEVINGSFMENARGWDVGHLTEDSPFMRSQPDSMDHSPVLRQLSDLTVLDFICGNADRTAENLFYQFDEQNRIIGIMGIDNDFSFGGLEPEGNDPPGFIRLNNFGPVSAPMAEKVQALTPALLGVVLAQRGISKRGIECAQKRLLAVQNALTENRLEVWEPEEFEKHTLKDIREAKKGSLFNRVGVTCVDIIKNMSEETKQRILQQKKPEKPEVKPLSETVAVRTAHIIADQAELSRHWQSIQNAKRHVFFGSPEYERIEKPLQKLQNFSKRIEKKSVISAEEAQAYGNTLELVYRACKAYLDKKEKEGTFPRDSKTGKRIKAVKDTMGYCENILKPIRRLTGAVNDTVRLQEESDAIQMEAFRANPKMAGDYIKSINIAAEQENISLKRRQELGRKIETVIRFQSAQKLNPAAMGLNEEDLRHAMENIRRGREAGVELTTGNKPAQKLAPPANAPEQKLAQKLAPAANAPERNNSGMPKVVGQKDSKKTGLTGPV